MPGPRMATEDVPPWKFLWNTAGLGARIEDGQSSARGALLFYITQHTGKGIGGSWVARERGHMYCVLRCVMGRNLQMHTHGTPTEKRASVQCKQCRPHATCPYTLNVCLWLYTDDGLRVLHTTWVSGPARLHFSSRHYRRRRQVAHALVQSRTVLACMPHLRAIVYAEEKRVVHNLTTTRARIDVLS